jgi:hypothetical protein
MITASRFADSRGVFAGILEIAICAWQPDTSKLAS